VKDVSASSSEGMVLVLGSVKDRLYSAVDKLDRLAGSKEEGFVREVSASRNMLNT